MFYFSNFPKTEYQVTSTGQTVTATDITKRFKMIDDFLKNKYVFYSYTIKDGETASIIAHKYYGDATYDWLIFMINAIYDPFIDWPLSSSEIENYIITKYGSLVEAKQTTHEYYQIIQPREMIYDGTIVQEQRVIIDHSTYLTIPDESRYLITKYDYEKQVNETKRIIKIVDKIYLTTLVEEFKNIFG